MALLVTTVESRILPADPDGKRAQSARSRACRRQSPDALSPPGVTHNSYHARCSRPPGTRTGAAAGVTLEGTGRQSPLGLPERPTEAITRRCTCGSHCGRSDGARRFVAAIRPVKPFQLSRRGRNIDRFKLALVRAAIRCGIGGVGKAFSGRAIAGHEANSGLRAAHSSIAALGHKTIPYCGR